MRKIFIDFDGTIVDVSDRLFFLYRDLMKKYNQETLLKEEYICLKRNRIPEEKILFKTTKDQELIRIISDERMLNIENEYLKYDKVVPGVESTLEELSSSYELYLITKRRSKKNFLDQVKKLGIVKYFRQLVVCNLGQNKNFLAKAEQILQLSPIKSDLVIGDTEEDIAAGKYSNLITIAVLTGVRSRKFLEEINPDYILDSINQIFTVIGFL